MSQRLHTQIQAVVEHEQRMIERLKAAERDADTVFRAHQRPTSGWVYGLLMLACVALVVVGFGYVKLKQLTRI